MTQDNSNAIVPSDWSLMQQQASTLVASGFLPKAIDTPQKAIAIIMLGRELGIAPWAALTGINVIQGKPAASPQLMLALIYRSGQLEDMRIEDDGQTCTVHMKRKGRALHTESFSMDDAKRMMTTEYVNGNKRSIPLADKYNWQQMPAVMRKWRAVAACARIVFADVILGMYTLDELGVDVDADDQGNMTVIDVRPEPPHPQQNGHEPETVSVEQSSAKVSVQPTRPTPPPASPAANPAPSGDSGNPLLDDLEEQPVITAVRPDEQVGDDDPNRRVVDAIIVSRSGKSKVVAFAIVNSHNRIPVMGDHNLSLLVGLTLNGEPIAERDSDGNIVVKLNVGTYTLDQEWGVYGIHDKDGWTLEKIEAERIPLP